MNPKDKILNINGKFVMLDSDLANMYGVETRVLNQAVKRNKSRFPPDFMFQLSENEVLRSQIVTSGYGGRRYRPYVFTEQGVAMLSAVLKSEVAVRVSIRIVRAFIALRKFIASNANMFQRMDSLEFKILQHDRLFESVFRTIERKNIIPEHGIIFDGHVFDAHKFASDLVRSADKSIVLIDNYVDDTTLSILSKKKKGVKAIVCTRITKPLMTDIKKFNQQYPIVEAKQFVKSHDRFMIIDGKKAYHIGASLKDLGKKWFAFSRIDSLADQILVRLLPDTDDDLLRSLVRGLEDVRTGKVKPL